VSYVVIVTPMEGANDFEVVGAFADKEDAMEWVQAAFHKPKYKDSLFRVKEMRSNEIPADATGH
jgi:hypothetical protein